MKKFQFSLETVLGLKEFREEECRIALGQAVSALNRIENEIKENALKQVQASAQRFTDPERIFSWDMYKNRLEQEAQKLMEQAARAEMEVEEKRAQYLEALNELKTLEKLKEKQRKEYRKKMLNSQMNEVDDLTSSRHGIR